MILKNLAAAVFLVVEELSHVAFAVADVCKPFGAFRDGLSFRLGFQSGGLLFENAVKQLLWRVGSVDGLGCFQYIQRELVAVGMEKIMRAACKAIDHLGSAHFLRAPPG